MIVEPRPGREQRVCLICGAVVDAGLGQFHEDWHTAISGVAIEQTNLIDQLHRKIAAIDPPGGAA